MKAVKNRLGGTLNDVVLATVAGALRRFLEHRRVNVEGLDFRVMVPVSVRAAEERGTLGNRVSAWVVDAADRRARSAPPPASRSARPRRALKDSKQALGAEMLDAGDVVDAVRRCCRSGSRIVSAGCRSTSS